MIKDKKTIIGWFLLFAPLLFFCCQRKGEERERTSSTVAFVNVNVVPMDSKRILENQTVIVQGDSIIQIGSTSEVFIPEQTFRIDGRDKYLMPGLADMHFHNENESDFVLCLANGITTIRNMWGDTKHLEWRRRIENGDLLGPAIITSGPLLDGPPPIWAGSTVIETVEQAREAVIEQKRAGYDFIKIYDRLSLEVFNAIMDEAEKQKIPVAGHVPFAVGLERFLNSGVVSNEHLTGYMELIQADDFPGKGEDDPVSRLRSWMYLDEQKIPAVMDKFDHSNIWNCVTLVVYQSLVSPSKAQGLLKRPEMQYVDPLMRASWDPSNDPRWEGLNEKDFEHRRKMDLILKQLTGTLHKKAGGILLGTDCQNKLVIPGFSIHRELQNLVDAGLSPYEALKAGTSDAAVFLGENTFGIVAPGKRADLILIEGNPLEDVSHVKELKGVMVKGKWLPQDKLQGMLENIAASFIPPENRFENVPPLSPKEEVIFSARFEMRYADVPMGEERFILERLPDGKKKISAQAVTDHPYRSLATMTMTIDDAGRCYSLNYNLKTDTGEKQIKMIQSEKKLNISENITSEEIREHVEDIPKAVLLGASMLSNILPAVEMAKSLDVGECIQINGKAIRVLPMWFTSFFLDETVIIKRASDRKQSDEGNVFPARVYEMEVSSKSFPHKYSIFLDSEGNLHELHFSSQEGLFKFVRIE